MQEKKSLDIDSTESADTGSNFFELIEFTLVRRLQDGTMKNGHYGVNVAKVREVVRMPVINPLASKTPGIAGVFELRGIPIPAIHLVVALGDPHVPLTDEMQIIVTEFSQKRAGFIVNSTHRIRRISWDKILPPTADKNSSINGMTLIENNEFLFILDLEKIISDIEQAALGLPQPSFLASNMDAHVPTLSSNGKTLLLVDDSSFILNNIKNVLEKNGYNVQTCMNGLTAKAFLEKAIHDSPQAVPIHGIVTDVEMPKMDGLTFTKWVKSVPQIKHIPVLLHTSLSGGNNEEIGLKFGAQGYIVKNDVQSLLHLLKQFVPS